MLIIKQMGLGHSLNYLWTPVINHFSLIEARSLFFWFGGGENTFLRWKVFCFFLCV